MMTYDEAVTEAAARGADRGEAAKLDGATEALEWLSGEWAGESVSELLGDLLEWVGEDDHDAILDAYCDAADDAFRATNTDDYFAR